MRLRLMLQKVGTASVPSGPSASSTASTTVSAPPSTAPRLLSELCMKTTAPCVSPRALSASEMSRRVRGATGVLAIGCGV